MINRKITKRLERFFEDNGRYALLIDGARQVGKTFVIENFAQTHYENVIEINFIKMANAKLIFSELKKHTKPDPVLAESGLRLTYGLLDGELTLAPAEYQGEEALYVEFHSRDMDYTYLAPHLRYKDFEMLVR